MAAPPYSAASLPQYQAPPYEERPSILPIPNQQSDSDLTFRVMTEGCQVFEEFNRKRRHRKIEKVCLTLYEWSLWIFIPLAFTTVLQYYATSHSTFYNLFFPTVMVLMLCTEFRAIRRRNHPYLMFYKYGQSVLYTFFFLYDVMYYAKIHPEADFIFMAVFVSHFAFYMFSLIRVYLIGTVEKVLKYQNQTNTVESIRLANI